MKSFGSGQDSSQEHDNKQHIDHLKAPHFAGGQCRFVVNAARETLLYSSHRGLRRSRGIELEGRCETLSLKGIEVSGSFEEGDIDQLTDRVIGEGPLRIWPNDIDGGLDEATVCGVLNIRYLEGYEIPYASFEVVLPGEAVEQLSKVVLAPFHFLAITLWTEADSRIKGTTPDRKDRSFLITSFEVFRSAGCQTQGS